MKDIIIEYTWNSRVKEDTNSYRILVNMTKKIFYIFKINLLNHEKWTNITNNTNCTIYYVDLQNKTSFSSLVDALRNSEFEEL